MGQTKIKSQDINQTEQPKPEVKASESKVETETKKSSKAPKQGKKYRSQKYLEKSEKVEKGKAYPIADAVKLAQETSYTKFPPTLEVHINTHLPNIRGLVAMPYLSGKSLRILAFGKGAKEAGVDIVGTDETLESINKGKIDFDIVVATPEWMPKLTKVARILGPKGLMPNPKSGTVADNLEKAVSELKGGKVEYKTEDKGQIIHMGVGKVNQPSEEIVANLKTLYNTIGRSKIKKITLSPTMGPGIKVELSSLS